MTGALPAGFWVAASLILLALLAAAATWGSLIHHDRPKNPPDKDDPA